MFGLTIDTKWLVIAACVVVALGGTSAVFIYYETRVANYERELRKERAETESERLRNAELTTRLARQAAEVAAANHAAEAAKRQARCVGEIGRRADHARRLNREALHESDKIEKTAAPMLQSDEAQRRARALLWDRVNELFLCERTDSSTAFGCGSSGLRDAHTP